MNIVPSMSNAASQDQGKIPAAASTGEAGAHSADPFAELLSQLAPPAAQHSSKSEPAPAVRTEKGSEKPEAAAEDSTAMFTLAALLQAAGLPVTVVSGQGAATGADPAAQGAFGITATAAAVSLPTVSGTQQPQSSVEPLFRAATAEGTFGMAVQQNTPSSLQGKIASALGEGTTTGSVIDGGRKAATAVQSQTAEVQTSSSLAVPAFGTASSAAFSSVPTAGLSSSPAETKTSGNASAVSLATALPAASPAPEISVLTSDATVPTGFVAPAVLSASASPTTKPDISSPQPSSSPDAEEAPSAVSIAALPAAQPAASMTASIPVAAPEQADPEMPQQQVAAALSTPATSPETASVGGREKTKGALQAKAEHSVQAVKTAASESPLQPTSQQETEGVSAGQAAKADSDGELHPSTQVAGKAASAPQSEPQQIAKQDPITITIQQQQPQPQTQSSSAAASSPETPKPALHESILAQVTEKLDNLQASGSKGEVTIRLHPEDLGELKINVRLDDQRVRVEIVTEHPMVKEALTDNLDRLKETFSRQNLTMEKFDVSTGGGQFNQPSNQGQWQNTAYASFNSKAAFPAGLSATAEPATANHWNPRADALVDVRF